MIELKQGYSALFLFELNGRAHKRPGKKSEFWELYVDLFKVQVRQKAINKFEFCVPEIQKDILIEMLPGQQSIKTISNWIKERFKEDLNENKR